MIHPIRIHVSKPKNIQETLHAKISVFRVKGSGAKNSRNFCKICVMCVYASTFCMWGFQSHRLFMDIEH